MRNHVADLARSLAAAGAFLAAVIHLDLYQDGFRELHPIGTLFLLDFAGGIALGVLAMLWRHWFPALLVAGFGATTVIFYWISVIHGLFGVKETTSGWQEVLAETAEYVAIVFGLIAVLALISLPRRRIPTVATPGRATAHHTYPWPREHRRPMTRSRS